MLFMFFIALELGGRVKKPQQNQCNHLNFDPYKRSYKHVKAEVGLELPEPLELPLRASLSPGARPAQLPYIRHLALGVLFIT